MKRISVLKALHLVPSIGRVDNVGWLKGKLFLTSIFSCLHSYLKPLVHRASMCGLAGPLSLSARKGPGYNRKDKKWTPTHLGPQPCPPTKEPFWTQLSHLRVA